MTPKQLFSYQTVAELAEVAEVSETAGSEQGVVTGTLPLTPIQHWFFEQNFVDPQHWNMALLLEASQPLHAGYLQKAVQKIVAHHDMLRCRFVQTDTGWPRRINTIQRGWQAKILTAGGMVPFSHIDLSSFSEGEQNSAMQAKAAEMQASLDLSEGQLLRVVYFDCGAQQPHRLLLIAHHLVIDGVSWRIVLEDLHTAYGQLNRGEKAKFPAKTTSFKQWAEKLAAHAQSEIPREETDFWLKRNHAANTVLPVDYANGRSANTMVSARTVTTALDADETRALLQEIPKAYNTQIDDVLLTALVQVFSAWTGVSSLPVDLEGHGREDILNEVDLSRTVGWFTTIYPVHLMLQANNNSGEALKSIKEQLRHIPNRGIGYGLLHYLNDDRRMIEKLRAMPQPEVSFNYLGQFGQALPDTAIFSMVEGDTGPVCNPNAKRTHLLEITARITRDCLQVEWIYSEKVHRRATIENLAQQYVDALRALTGHCR
ncbi:MAG: condensation domain-containing protein, partial [bacterium]